MGAENFFLFGATAEEIPKIREARARGEFVPDPRLVEVPCDLKTATGRMIYANSITLTPGTVTIDVGPHYLVHALTPEDEAGLLDGSMLGRVRGLEGDAGAASAAEPKDAS